MIIKNTFNLILSRFSIIPLNIITGILIARVLGPASLGIYAIMWWLPSILAGPMSLGVANANLYFGAQNQKYKRPLTANSIFLSLSIFLVVFFIISLCLWFFPNLIPKEMSWVYLLIPLLSIPFRLMIMFTANLFNAWEDHKSYRNTELVQSIAYFLFCIIGVFFFHMSLWGFVLTRIGASVVACFYTLMVLSSRNAISCKIDWELLKKSVNYGLRIQINSFIRLASQNADALILLHFAGAKQVGFLNVAKSITNHIRMIPYSLATVIAPKFAQERRGGPNLASKAIKQLLLLACPIIIFLVLILGPVVVFVYGEAYRGAIMPLQILMLSLLPISMNRIVQFYLMINNYTSILIKSSFISAGFLLFLDFLLIPKFGINGGVFACLLSMSLETVIIMSFFLKQTRLNLRELIIPTRSDFAIFTKAFFHVLKKISTPLN